MRIARSFYEAEALPVDLMMRSASATCDLSGAFSVLSMEDEDGENDACPTDTRNVQHWSGSVYRRNGLRAAK